MGIPRESASAQIGPMSHGLKRYDSYNSLIRKRNWEFLGVERNLAKVEVVSSNLIARSNYLIRIP
jgi:hypothetical protein